MSPFTACQACVLKEAGGFVMPNSARRSLEEGRARADQGSLGRFSVWPEGGLASCWPHGRGAVGHRFAKTATLLPRSFCWWSLVSQQIFWSWLGFQMSFGLWDKCDDPSRYAGLVGLYSFQSKYIYTRRNPSCETSIGLSHFPQIWSVSTRWSFFLSERTELAHTFTCIILAPGLLCLALIWPLASSSMRAVGVQLCDTHIMLVMSTRKATHFKSNELKEGKLLDGLKESAITYHAFNKYR